MIESEAVHRDDRERVQWDSDHGWLDSDAGWRPPPYRDTAAARGRSGPRPDPAAAATGSCGMRAADSGVPNLIQANSEFDCPRSADTP